jgi:hypothetical protein
MSLFKYRTQKWMQNSSPWKIFSLWFFHIIPDYHTALCLSQKWWIALCQFTYIADKNTEAYTGLCTISLTGRQNPRNSSPGVHKWVFFRYDFWAVRNPLKCFWNSILAVNILLETLPTALLKPRILNGNVCTLSLSATPPLPAED